MPTLPSLLIWNSIFMQPAFLALIVTLAPLPAAAFGNLDCISIESCINIDNDATCTPQTNPFAVTFDWNDDAATVSMFGTDHALIWMNSGDGDDGLSTLIEYADIDGTDRALSIVAQGTDITAYYSTIGESGLATWVGVCDVRQAA